MARLFRRDFLRALVVVAGPPLAAGCSSNGAKTPPAPDYFPQSVASGDPRSTSVVLWTRVFDAQNSTADLTLELVVATDDALANPVTLEGAGAYPIVAQAAADGCVKVRVEGLAPSTTYYFQFTYVNGDARSASRVGRTRTAPDEADDRDVTFAVVSCQDFGGKYYHAYRHLAEQPLDFVLHLGDYIYETIDDPSFQSTTPDRTVSFSAPEEALSIDDGSVLAARSLGNYRDLYRTYRSDPDLQRVHELFPMIAIPDDHEFSNDCYGATATYTNDREDETDYDRRRAADKAWFEYTPVDYVLSPASALDETATFPDDFTLYRNFVFGQRLELVVTDLRRYRPDHVVPEGALPGAVFMTQDEAVAVLGAVPDDAVAYLDSDDASFDDVRPTLLDAASAQDFEASAITGLLSVPWINQVIVANGGDAPLDETDSAYERGYAYHQLLKAAEFTEQGSRYLLAERPFRALAEQRFGETNGESESLLGDTQRAWFTSTLAQSTRRWKVWANEYTFMRRAIDLTPVELAPEEYRQRLLLSAEDWDGAPNERNALLKELKGVDNVIVVTGDLHAFLAGTPYAEDDEDARVIELVAGSLTSTTLLTGVKAVIADDPSLPPSVAVIADVLGSLLQDTETMPNPHLGWLELAKNGYAVVTAGAESCSLTAYAIDDALVPVPASGLTQPLDALFEAVQFRVADGSRELEQLIDGAWMRWDRTSSSWVAE
ncbi:MAG TPA: alkaline phosphatase D family protein [Polyangiaceae bacterium]|nr:alkaline phosphatase D family protein [Polyangiaceae bacterium]